MKAIILALVLLVGCAARGPVRMGMTRSEVISARGKPGSVHVTAYRGYRCEQWVYGGEGQPFTPRMLLYFEGDTLAGWQR